MAQQLEHLKWIQGTTFMVDGFRFQNPRCTKYFLTHFHADHTTGELTALSASAAAHAAEQKESERQMMSPTVRLLSQHTR